MSIESIAHRPSAEYTWAFVLSIFLSVSFTYVANLMGKDAYVIVAFAVIPLFLIAAFNLQYAMYVLIASLFIHALFYYVAPGVWCAMLLLLSFTLTRRELLLSELRTPLSVPFLAYCLMIVPSFLNASDPIRNFAMLHNLFVFCIVFHIIAASFVRRENIQKSISVYLFFVLLNSINVIAQGLLTGKRAFGFAGVMFVDYVGTGLVIVTALALMNKGARSFYYFLLAGVFTAALVLTQTRGAWLVTAVTIALMVMYLFFRGERFGVSRSTISAFSIASASFILVVFLISRSFGVDVSKRTEEIVASKQVAVDEEGGASNSLVMRVLIWSTAYNAFRAHPVVGIGAYGFPYSSRRYSTLPRILYDRYVKDLTPHLGYLAVVTETGIVGLIGFLIFVLAGLKTVFKPLSLTAGFDATHSLIFAWVFTYIVISLFTTDAWLWGQGVVLMAIVIGFACANEKLVRGMG